MLALLPLALLLPAGTEPSAPVMTDASTPISISVSTSIDLPPAKKRPSRRARAKAAFLHAEAKRDEYLQMSVKLDQGSIAAKVRAAEALAGAYRNVTTKKDPELTLAAWVRIGELYLHFADEIRRAHGAERSDLEAMAMGPERRAAEALARGRTHAQTYQVQGTWRRRLEQLTQDSRPTTHDRRLTTYD
jgi:hypothetical protein